MLLLACSSSDGGHPIHRLVILLAGEKKKREKRRRKRSDSDCCACYLGIHPWTVVWVPPFFSPRDPGRALIICCNLQESVTSVGTSPAMEEAKRKV